ncbi:NUDIX domain-containing protein [Halomicroarcula sp. F28]|uniref:NUDIX hydrolase n=1 Tax=Haloarcula salinisoli TaxID=2487746 RepID=UPI001C72E9D6|nr:NUDIX domain-containing protein [Halomicroarcula salinisoli]MBX0288241.1 NUDIX domain-containing protein [Halomicroarcula salinisoli]
MGGTGETDRDIPSDGRGAARVRTGVKALVSSSEKVLLLREHHCDGRAFWTLPGGGVHRGEKPERALHRELTEELQCGAVVGTAIDWYAYAHASTPDLLSVYTVYDCAVVERPAPNATEGIDQCRWVRPDSLPPRTLSQVRSVVSGAHAPPR